MAYSKHLHIFLAPVNVLFGRKPNALGALEPLSGRVPERVGDGALVIQPGPERRRTSSHYTPRELTEPIVARTLEPFH